MDDPTDPFPADSIDAAVESSAEQRLAELGIALPDASDGLGAYAPWSRVGDIVTTSGQFPWRNGALGHVGRLGATLTTDEGYDAARLCAISAMAQLRVACGGNLARVRRIVRVEGNLLCTPDFEDHAAVLDGASDVLNAVIPSPRVTVAASPELVACRSARRCY